MRGDSLRDLYAKAIALAGLALLAAAGALFDYWPVTSDLPRLAGPARADLTTVQALNIVPTSDTPIAVVARRAPEPRVVRAAVQAPVETVAPAAAASVPVVALAVLAATPMTLSRFGTPLALTEPPVPAQAIVEVIPEDDLALPIVSARFAELHLAGDVGHFAAPVVDDDTSALDYVTGAFKKTGRTLMRTGAKTGATIRDALLRFGGAFKKVL